jgi:hypothetical protein
MRALLPSGIIAERRLPAQKKRIRLFGTSLARIYD